MNSGFIFEDKPKPSKQSLQSYQEALQEQVLTHLHSTTSDLGENNVARFAVGMSGLLEETVGLPWTVGLCK